MLIYAFGVSVDGFIADRDGDFAWTAPDDELFAVHLERVRGLGAYLMGRRLYEAMRVWETDPAMRRNADTTAFADVWAALPKVVFSRTLTAVEGNARLATGTVADEIAALGDTTAEIGGAELAAQAVHHIDELHIFRAPVLVGGGTPHLPPVAKALRLLETRAFPSQVVLECYGVSRDA